MKLVNELKRRNVVRVGIAYIVVGWIVLQVGDVLFDMFGTPAWVGKTMAALLFLGFPIACIFAWAFELTPEGIKKTADVDRSDSVVGSTGRKLDFITIGAFVIAIAIGVGLWYQARKPAAHDAESVDRGESIETATLSTADKSDIEQASIAVLPFADLSPEGDQEYFSDGISEEILNVLVRIENLKVASRTSSFGFKSQAQLGIPAIAEKLKVRHVLEGSVRKAGDNVRITAQLIDAQTDAHLWSETFDRTLTTQNIFAIQDEIAKAIVIELGLLIGDERASPAPREAATDNLDAYSMYLKAQGLFHRRSRETVPEIVTLYERAVELDPEFAEAWAGLASAYAIVPGWNLGTVEEFLPRAREAADRASALDDRLSGPYAVRGGVASDLNDQLSAFESLTAALERDSNNTHTRYIYGVLLLELGYLDRAESEYRRCLAIDPAYEICRRFLSFVLLFQGNDKEAASLFEIGMLRGQNSWRHVFLGYYAATGNDSALALLIAEITPNQPWRREPLFRLFSDRSYSMDSYLADIRAGSLAATGEPVTEDFFDPDDFRPRFTGAFFWSPYFFDRLRPEVLDGRGDEWRKMWMTRRGMVEFWRQEGFPPQCRPVGEDDFWCEGFPEDDG